MSCKIVVYENKQDKVKVGMQKLTALNSMVEDEDLKEIGVTIENRLISCKKKQLLMAVFPIF